LMFTPTVASSRSIVGAWLLTVTSSAVDATSIFPTTVTVVPAVTLLSSIFRVLNPGGANDTRYVPGGNSVNRYAPVSSVTSLRAPPIMAGHEIVTSTPGTTAPVVSTALAVMFDVRVWENAGEHSSNAMPITAIPLKLLFKPVHQLVRSILISSSTV